jgi:hypothetical protein
MFVSGSAEDWDRAMKINYLILASAILFTGVSYSQGWVRQSTLLLIFINYSIAVFLRASSNLFLSFLSFRQSVVLSCLKLERAKPTNCARKRKNYTRNLWQGHS